MTAHCIGCGGTLRHVGRGRVLEPLAWHYECTDCGREHGECRSCGGPTAAWDDDRCSACVLEEADALVAQAKQERLRIRTGVVRRLADHGWTTRRIAAHLGISPVEVSRLARHEAVPTLEER